MVKNTKGGTGTKGLARKHQNNNNNTSYAKSRLPSCDLERIAICTKMLGNGMCNITTSNNLTLLGHIRNKFRGQHKRHNSISKNSILLIGLREWETVSKNCDILYIYDEREIDSISSNPALDISIILNLRNGNANLNQYHLNDLFSNHNDLPHIPHTEHSLPNFSQSSLTPHTDNIHHHYHNHNHNDYDNHNHNDIDIDDI